MLLTAAVLILTISVGIAEYTDPHCEGRQVIVHLFEWKWSDIADECERYLGKKGFCGVQVSPPNENVVVTTPMRPWWERYQPVSYKIVTRSGDEAAFRDMVKRCRNVGVRIFVDSVINHMSGLGRRGTGTGGSHFDADNFDFPAVPYSRQHFTERSKCPSGDGNVNNYGDPNNVRNCFLVGLTDLNQNLEYVRDKIAGYFNHLIDIGVAGFRIDASKHMWPNDLMAIQSRVKDLPEGGKPFFCHEVIDQNDGAIKVNEYYSLGYVTEFRYCQKIAQGVQNFGELNNMYVPDWGMADPAHAFIFVDNHDNQRGSGGGGRVVTHKKPRDYKMAVAFTLAYNYGFTRIMSSYYFSDGDEGPPHNNDYSTKDVPIQSDGSCGNGWVCEHRWNPIGNMVAFRNAVTGTDIGHWRNQNGELSFARGNKGFFAMSKSGHMDNTLQTGLPAGEYCDLISDCKKKITVDGSGNAHIVIDNAEEPIIAFIVGGATGSTDGAHSIGGAGSGNGGNSGSHGSGGITPAATTTQGVPTGPVPTGWARTVILIEKQTSNGQDIFLRGGLDHGHQQGCSDDPTTSACAIPIKSHSLGTSNYYDSYNAWRTGDNYLDWSGAEQGQLSYHGYQPLGTPAKWTTNDPNNPNFNSMNTYGPHFWLVDVDMDCSRTLNGWFEIKGIVSGQWEHDLGAQSCGNGPYKSNNHWAKCGSKNVFHFDSTQNCEISALPKV